MIRTLVSNKLALRNPISEEIHNAFLAECYRIVYHHRASRKPTGFSPWVSEPTYP